LFIKFARNNLIPELPAYRREVGVVAGDADEKS